MKCTQLGQEVMRRFDLPRVPKRGANSSFSYSEKESGKVTSENPKLLTSLKY